MEKLIIVGAGGHAKTVIDTIERQRVYEICGIVAPEDIGTEIYRGYRVGAHDDDLPKLFARGISAAVVGIGFLGRSTLREKIYKQLKDLGYALPVIVDDTALVAKSAVTGEGTYVGRGAIVNADAVIGKMCIINSGAIVEHECSIGDFSHVAVGAVVCGQTKVGSRTLIGANATVIQCRTVGNNAIVGAGSVVVDDVLAGEQVTGVPAKRS